eukprot:TRINITY_DN12653_c0_g3_i1.p2 TRINITY_DN12653_c0_g3~~TRINITY_DN12653_c0_g3_i1.p2  ORF type:complete len:145 (-),score=12.42 TRINITY_DN12653_c0_g3_i1:731-1165(-)
MWKKSLLGEPNIEVSAPKLRRGNRKRQKELLAHRSSSLVESTIEDALKKLKDPEVLTLSLEDLEYLLDYFDTSHANWHVLRGLPKKLASYKDLLVMTYELDESGLEYLQDYCLLGIKEDGYEFIDYSIGSQIHIDCVWTLRWVV